MIIAVADIHLGDRASNKTGFSRFIREYLKPRREEITDLVLLGDILDLWRKSNSRVLSDNQDILDSLCSFGFNVQYIVGNHDIAMLNFNDETTSADRFEEAKWDFDRFTFGEEITISNGGTSFRFVHGHQSNYWYALPFYESFCQVMCDVPEILTDNNNIWETLKHQSDNLSPSILKKIRLLQRNEQSQIEARLAGPLEGQNVPLEKSMFEDFKTLSEFVEYRIPRQRKGQLKILEEVGKEVRYLTENIQFERDSKNWNELINNERNRSLEEMNELFLAAWSEMLQWAISLKVESKQAMRRQIIRAYSRVAAILSGYLQHDEFLVRGHGHSPYVDLQSSIADAGCWLGKRASYIVIDNGEITLNNLTS